MPFKVLFGADFMVVYIKELRAAVGPSQTWMKSLFGCIGLSFCYLYACAVQVLWWFLEWKTFIARGLPMSLDGSTKIVNGHDDEKNLSSPQKSIQLIGMTFENVCC